MSASSGTTTAPTPVPAAATAAPSPTPPLTPGAADPTPPPPTIGDLVATVSKDVSLLVRQEVELAKLELTSAATKAGIGAGLFGGAGFFVLTAWFLVSIGFAELVHSAGMSVAVSFLIVAGGYLLVAVVLALVGKGRISKVRPPTRTIATVKQDLAVLHRGGSEG